ncbi:flagellar biosynthesis anti-sigma factor FlgM [Pseudobacillus badius]|uniref:flagellar biosynthesis anti-sigma factor FlgM n=1 Tax=Bacillus badius TaxID=1455 RepID=UPI0007B097DA|nr:flagellar biosynthesis anti-sigma factor FlgM [Bacillus badius]KZO00146.1 flagellar biosynthesis anti-sigma factor FlgM [Bacillus badius]MED0668537.1 flagellar biosynthesis anti-sigma factor FlgM [Bacillus badius]OCS86308.1 flagellar biosynthesis anti-sigma factor FlgM [Bacillus badius]OVE52232.1 flagellar biosynthesis anti-sigma factor FlgM [Bacillus badius]TDW03949.1 FlgM family anti-sigma-28 factor [Bacillus badius]
MKINQPGVQGINPYQKQLNKTQGAKKAAAAPTDKLEISSAAKGMQEVSKMAKERMEKIASLKQQIAKGEYQPQPEKIAEGIVKFYKK